MMRLGAMAADLALSVWLVSFLAWAIGRRAGRLAGQQLVRVAQQLPAYGSAALVVVLPALLLAWAVYR